LIGLELAGGAGLVRRGQHANFQAFAAGLVADGAIALRRLEGFVFCSGNAYRDCAMRIFFVEGSRLLRVLVALLLGF
jgi:hypothetical protein